MNKNIYMYIYIEIYYYYYYYFPAFLKKIFQDSNVTVNQHGNDNELTHKRTRGGNEW